MNTRIAGLCGTVGFALLLATTGAHAQAPVSSLSWDPNFGQAVLGRGLQIHPNQVSVVGGAGVAGTPYKWQQDSQSLTILDYSSFQSTMQALNLNAWGEANGFLAGGSFSVNWSQYSAFQGNHRHWEIDANYYKTAFLPAPQLTSAALKLVSNPAKFAADYGNYAVTGIKYRQRLAITWDAVFNTSVSQSQFAAAVSGSYGMFSGGASVSSFFSQLQSFAQTTVTVTVEGANGGPVFSAAIGSTNDLNALTQKVAQLLQGWGPTPKDPTQAGIIDTVYVTPYPAIPGGPPVVPDFSPTQTDLANAIAQYVFLDQSLTRLKQIPITDTNLNPTLSAYIAAKINEATATRSAAIAYITDLKNGQPPVTPPDLSFQFDDPDVVQWRVLEAFPVGNTSQLFVEIYSNARVTPINTTSGDANDPTTWCTTCTLQTTNGVLWYNVKGGCPESLSYTLNLDPVTGIPYRYCNMEWNTPNGVPTDTTIQLISDSGLPFYNATDWNGWPSPALFIPQSSFVPLP